MEPSSPSPAPCATTPDSPPEIRGLPQECGESGAASVRGVSRRGDRLSLLVLFLSFLATCGYFEEQATGWNANTRLDLAYAIVERGSFSIDYYHKIPYLQTGDKAYYRGHFYCDKSPGLSFAAAPIYWVLWHLKTDWGFLAKNVHSFWVQVSRYVMRVLTVSLAAAALGLLIHVLARRCGVSRRIAFLLAVGIVLGTFLFGYATQFYPYLPAAFFSMASYALVFLSRDPRPGSAPPGGAKDLSRGSRLFWAGLLLGLGWFFEYTVGLLGIGLGFYTLWFVRRRPWVIWKYVVGGLIPVACFCAYSYSVFGEFSVPYKYEYDGFFREQMAKGFQGIHPPRLSVFWLITFHPYKGLFFYSPFLLLWFLGLARGFADREVRRFRPDLVLSLYVVGAYLLFNSGYYMWWGGWAAGPRLLGPAVPFFLIPLALYLRKPERRLRIVFGTLLAVSVWWNLVITSVAPQAPPGTSDANLMAADVSECPQGPVFDALLPLFLGMQDKTALTAEEGIKDPSWAIKYTLAGTVTNAGKAAFGIEGILSLIPLGVLWIAVGFWIVFGCREEGG